MAYLRRWDPFSEMRRMLREAWLPFWSEDWATGSEIEGVGLHFSVDMYEEGDNVVVKAELPGIDPNAVDVTVTKDTVTITAEKKAETEEKGRNYLRRERRFGTFSRTLALPAQVVPDKSRAKFENGTLILTMPKVEEEKSGQVKVEVERGTN